MLNTHHQKGLSKKEVISLKKKIAKDWKKSYKSEKMDSDESIQNYKDYHEWYIKEKLEILILKTMSDKAFECYQRIKIYLDTSVSEYDKEGKDLQLKLLLIETNPTYDDDNWLNIVLDEDV